MTFGLMLLLAAASPMKLAAPGFQCAGVEPALCDAYLEHFVARVVAGGVQVTTKNDVAQVLGVERQRQLLGCGAESSCLAELAGALGVVNVLTGTVAKTESGYLSTLKVVRVEDGTTDWSATSRTDDERGLLLFLETEADRLAGRSGGASTVVRWIPAMVGGTAALVGGLLLGLSRGEAVRLEQYTGMPRLTDLQLSGIAQSGRTLQAAGWSLVAAGSAGIVASVVWALLAPGASGAAVLVPVPGGAALGLSGRLP